MTHFLRRIQVIFLYVLPVFICIILLVSCKPSKFDDLPLQFSYFTEDKDGKEQYVMSKQFTLTFDTVFTSIGSITRQFMVHNTSNQEITIKSIILAGGNQSFYSINVNGMSGTSFKDITIPKKDSIFVFVKVNINPDTPISNSPFFVKDSILFITGQFKQEVKLLAYGQNARYIVANQGSEGLRYRVVAGEHETVTWNKDLPYVVYGWAVIDSTGTLIIDPGTKLYFHNNSGLWAYRYSNLEVNGTLQEPILFRGDRLESWFDTDYAQWSRIWINEGADATINNAIITNAFVGIQVEPLPYNDNHVDITTNSLVKIDNTIIKNTQDCGVLSRFLNIEMTNCVIANNGASSLQLEGGNYTLKHLTVANYFKQAERKAPACYMSNVVSFYNNSPWDIKADFVNCIIDGKLETEIIVNKAQNAAELDISFQNCLLKAKDNSSYFKDCLCNEDPKFTDIEKLDFTLLSGSPAIGKGKVLNDVPLDILGNPRGDKPDLGAYQFVK